MVSQAVRDAASIIRSAGQTAAVYRAGASVKRIDGVVPGPLTKVGDIPIELGFLNPRDLAEIGASAVASVLPDADIRENDILDVDGVRYQATEVRPHRLEGTLTHLYLHLEKWKEG